MSDLRPRGKRVEIGGEAHSLLFSLNVVDAVQDQYKETVSQTLLKLLDPMEAPRRLRFILTELLNDEKRRNRQQGWYTEEEVGALVTREEIPGMTAAVIAAYGEAIPEETKEDDQREAELLDVAELILLATTKMGYSEEEVFSMTPKKFFLLLDRYLNLNGAKGKNRQADIDMLP